MSTPGAALPTTGVTIGDTLAGSHGGFGLHEPPKMRKALSSTSGGQTPQNDGAHTPTAADSSNDQVQGGPVGSQAIRGTLNVKLIQARGLHVQPGASETQPYVVMQFEQNEFVSRTPHAVSNPSHVPFTTARPQPLGRTSSGGLGSITRAFADAMGRGKGKETSGNRTPKPEEGWLGKPGLGDPIWKEEVTLWVRVWDGWLTLAISPSRPRSSRCQCTTVAAPARGSSACSRSSLFSKTGTL